VFHRPFIFLQPILNPKLSRNSGISFEWHKVDTQRLPTNTHKADACIRSSHPFATIEAIRESPNSSDLHEENSFCGSGTDHDAVEEDIRCVSAASTISSTDDDVDSIEGENVALEDAAENSSHVAFADAFEDDLGVGVGQSCHATHLRVGTVTRHEGSESVSADCPRVESEASASNKKPPFIAMKMAKVSC
jgi:hypothetical protein